MTRRLIALLLLVPPQGPVALWWGASTGAAEHECKDHVCFCARRPAQGSEAAPCHGERQDDHGLRMSPACDHTTGVHLPATEPYLPAEPVPAAPQPSPIAPVLAKDGAAAAGFETIDLPPPRPA